MDADGEATGHYSLNKRRREGIPSANRHQFNPEDVQLGNMLNSSSGDLGQHGPGDLDSQQQQQLQLQAAMQQQALQQSNNQQELPKRGRGRPIGSKNKIAKAGNPMIPHVVIVNHGEDVQLKLKELSRSYRRSLVVLAASGSLSVATLMQVGASGQGVGVTLRGHFTILSISGALLQPTTSETEGLSKRAAREPTNIFLSASLANPTGGVVGGTVAGPLEAAGPVTLVIGHWDPDKVSKDLGDDSDAVRAGPSSANVAGGAAAGYPGSLGPTALVGPPGVPGLTALPELVGSLAAHLMPHGGPGPAGAATSWAMPGGVPPPVNMSGPGEPGGPPDGTGVS